MAERAGLIDLIPRLAGARVAVIGDVMLDRYVMGEVERISPEAPIPILSIRRRTSMLGGTGNVVRNIAALGAKVDLVAVIGSDDAGAEVARFFKELPGVRVDLTVDATRPTTIKTRFVSGTQQMMRADEESTAPLPAAIRDELIEAGRQAIAQAAVVVLSDYAKGVLKNGVAAALIKIARDASKAVIVDPKGRDFSAYRGASIITPNRLELAEASGKPADGDDAIVAAARGLIDGLDFDAVLATRSRDGMTLVRRDDAPLHLPTEAREVFDVSGAGDTVIAALAAALAAGAALPEAAALANAAAGVVVGKVGTAAVYAEELRSALHHQDIARAEAKELSLGSLLERVDRWRRAGLKVGFTNGCFDLLHPGHIRLLTQSRDACDRLIVGLNDDASVKRLKGPDRPIQGEASRAAVLASLASVDAVVLFAEDTPIKLIEAVRPDVLVKGSDYTVDKVVGADLVQKNGGKVVLVELAEGHSTTNTIKRMGRS
jgi:D-beta-D-heptose 7-phosphate kinase/D-beta-D-heptose 1-phosphate adenosyltransferase